MSDGQNDSLKAQAHALIDGLPDDATWDHVMEAVYLCQVVEEGIADGEAGRVFDVEEVRRRYGL